MASHPAATLDELSISELMTAARQNNMEEILNLSTMCGLPTVCIKTTDYNVLQRQNRDIDRLIFKVGCNVNSTTGNSKLTVLETLPTPLYLAVEHGDHERMMMLLQKGASIDTKDYNSGQTPLHRAAVNRSTNLLSKLLDFDINVNLCDSRGNTVLHIILNQTEDECRINKSVDTEVVRKLLTKGASVNCKDELKQTPLHLAAKLKQKDILPMLLPLATDVNQCNSNNNSVLHVLLSSEHANSACSEEPQNLEIVKALLKQEAKPDLLNNSGQSPAHLAAKNQHLKILSLLLQHFKDVNQTDHEDKTILHHLLDNFWSLGEEFTQLLEVLVCKDAKADAKNKDKNALLYFLQKLPNKTLRKPNKQVLEFIKIMLSNGVSVEGIDARGRSVLDFASKSMGLLMVLLEHGKDVAEARDSRGNSLLHVYLKEHDRSLETVRMILAKGVKVNVNNGDGQTAMHLATKYKEYQILQLLMSHSTDVDARDKDGNNVLHVLLSSAIPIWYDGYDCEIAMIKDDRILKTAEMLLQNGHHRVDAANLAGETALHLACRIFRPDVLQLLLAYGAKPGVRDKLLNSCLHCLCQAKKCNQLYEAAIEEKWCRFFLSQGCRANDRNGIGQTALHLAAKNGRINLARMLIETGGADVDCVEMSGRGARPLHLAAANQYDEVVELLLQCGADVNARQISNGASALQLAVYDGTYWARHVKLLLEHGADPEQRDHLGRTALHWTDNNEYKSGLVLLLEHGVDVSVKDHDGRESDFERPWNRRKVIEQYLAKLRAIGVVLNLTLYEDCASRTYEKNQYNSILEAELEEMRMVALDCRNSLYNLLRMNANRLAIYKNNLVLQEILASEDFETRFSNYGIFIRGRMRLGQRRAEVLDPAVESLCRLTGISLPECSYKISEYLSNECLRNVIEAESGEVWKRRINDNEAD